MVQSIFTHLVTVRASFERILILDGSFSLLAILSLLTQWNHDEVGFMSQAPLRADKDLCRVTGLDEASFAAYPFASWALHRFRHCLPAWVTLQFLCLFCVLFGRKVESLLQTFLLIVRVGFAHFLRRSLGAIMRIHGHCPSWVISQGVLDWSIVLS